MVSEGLELSASVSIGEIIAQLVFSSPASRSRISDVLSHASPGVL